ncbi:MAG TPA: formate dehydrogenase subunit delta [Steroidobacteraceae bacterium]|jgi:formate dehydrogenase subunit delta|nr:formate dehydrogenase subunit delta [Steroidobacteraceae bacterium]
MNIDLLVKMVNEISAYFASEADAEQAANDVAGHLRRYWEPRMRRQIIAYYGERQGAGLSDLALRGVGRLAATEPPAAASGKVPPRNL